VKNTDGVSKRWLRQYAEARAISAVVLEASSVNGGGYSYTAKVQLTWCGGLHPVVRSADGVPRSWTSFERLLASLSRDGVELRQLVVNFVG